MVRRWLLIILSLLLGTRAAPIGAQSENRAGLVVQYGDGRVATYCVRFDEPSITGLDLLQRSGLKIVAEVGGLGSAVCAIGGQGCAYPSQPCFCQCQGAQCAYWNYFHLMDGAWQYSPLGGAGYAIADGAVDGWAWGDKTAPPVYTIDQICAAPPPARPTNRPTIEPTIDSANRQVDTPAPSPTLEPAIRPTAEPTRQPTIQPTIEPTSEPVDRRSEAPADSQLDVSSYALFAIVVIGLGGWLLVSRARRD
jgi:hypothetical protein